MAFSMLPQIHVLLVNYQILNLTGIIFKVHVLPTPSLNSNRKVLGSVLQTSQATVFLLVAPVLLAGILAACGATGPYSHCCLLWGTVQPV